MKKIVIEAEWMENIQSFAERMIELAKQENCIVEATFNEVPLTTENMNSAEDILEKRKEFYRQQEIAYLNSPQYALDQERRRQERLIEEQKAERLLQEFRTLDFDSVPDVVNWLGRMANVTNDISANLNEVLPKLRASGYVPLSELPEISGGENLTAENYIKNCEDLNEVGIYIIARAMQDIEEILVIHGSTNYFANLYMQRKAQETQRCANK